MKNFIIFVANPIELDSEFLAVVERADRKEMCAYRNAIIEERLRRKGKLVEGKNNNSSSGAEQFSFGVARWLFLAIGGIGVWIAVENSEILVNSVKNGDFLGAFLLGLLTLWLISFSLGSFAKFCDERRSRMTTFGALVDYLRELFKRRSKGAAKSIEQGDPQSSSHPSSINPDFAKTLKNDSGTLLDIKQNRLDSLLGF